MLTESPRLAGDQEVNLVGLSASSLGPEARGVAEGADERMLGDDSGSHLRGDRADRRAPSRSSGVKPRTP
jgi:hypothetical protein